MRRKKSGGKEIGGWRIKAIYTHDDSWTAHFLLSLSLRSSSLSLQFFLSPSLSFLSLSLSFSPFVLYSSVYFTSPFPILVQYSGRTRTHFKMHKVSFFPFKNMINCCFFSLFDSVSTSFIFWLFTTSPKRQQKSSLLEFVTVKKFSHSLLSVMFVFSLSLSLSLSHHLCIFPTIELHTNIHRSYLWRHFFLYPKSDRMIPYRPSHLSNYNPIGWKTFGMKLYKSLPEF